MFQMLQRDGKRYAGLGGWYTCPGFWIIAVYRLGNWAHTLPSALLRVPFWLLYRLLRFPLRIYNVDIWAGPNGARIGAGACLIHPNNILIARGTEIGEDCLIFHEVTLGTGPLPGRPKIGNGVDIYVGARVLGGVTVGDRSMIGANCVVLQNVPPRSVVVPASVRVIPRALSPVAGIPDREGKTNTSTPTSSP